MVPDSTQNTRACFSVHFGGFTLLKNLKAPESGWRLFNALSASTEAEFGPRQSARKALLSISLSAKSYDRTPNNKEEKKLNAVLLIAASIIAAVRLYRARCLHGPSPPVETDHLRR